jgi:hypothetical protein
MLHRIDCPTFTGLAQLPHSFYNATLNAARRVTSLQLSSRNRACWLNGSKETRRTERHRRANVPSPKQ